MKLSRKISREIIKSFIITLLICLIVLIPLQKKKAAVIHQKIISLMQSFLTKDIDPIANAIFENRKDAINIRIADINAIDGVKSGYIFNSQFELLSNAESFPTIESLKPHFNRSLENEFDSWIHKNNLWYLQPITTFDKVIGYILVEYSLIEMNRAENLSIIFYAGIIFIFFSILMVAIHRSVKKVVLFPVQNLIDMITRIKKKDSVSLQIEESDDEIGVLSKSFEMMQASISKNIEELNTYNQSLLKEMRDREQAQAELKRSEEKYRSMMEAMKEGIYICSPELKIEYMNPAMIKRLGKDTTGEFCHSAIYNNDSQCEWCAFDIVKTKESVEYEIESPIDKHVYTVTNIPIVRTDKSVSKLTISRDITEIKLVKEQLYETQKMDSIGRLAGGIAHDFNNILSGIFGYLELAKLNIDEPLKVQKNIDQLKKGASRAADLVQQILTLSRQSEHQKTQIRMYLVIKEAIKFLQSSIPTNIEIKQNISSRSYVLADPTQIYQIVMNLCTNAYHAMFEKGGTLFIGLDEVESNQTDSTFQDIDISNSRYLLLTVKDTGCGMSSKILKKIFDPYFTTKQIGEGTGLGLAIVLGIVKDHDGYIKAHSKLGNGSKFSVYLPIYEDKLSSGFIRAENHYLKPLKGGTENIMVIDDDDAILLSTKELLEDYGYKVTSLSNGSTALEKFNNDPFLFDLVITDMTMPKMTGDDLSKNLLTIRKDLPIILCTGYSEKFTKKDALTLGIKKYVLKPVNSMKLLSLIREILDNDQS